MDNACQKLECCVDALYLGITLSSFIDLDICNQRLTIGIQGRSHAWSTESFSFGETVDFDLYGLMKMRYNGIYMFLNLFTLKPYPVVTQMNLCCRIHTT